MAPPLPSGPYKVRAIGCGGAMDSSFVFGAICHHIKKIEKCRALALGGRRSTIINRWKAFVVEGILERRGAGQGECGGAPSHRLGYKME
jgi:hypothetical protein